MKLTTMTQITLDGVTQGNGKVSDQERAEGFERGGWALGESDEDTWEFINKTYQRADAFLFGRLTYELFPGSWGAIPEMRTHPVGAALNSAPKYVVSNTLTDPEWENTTVLSGDFMSEIRALKATSGGELQVHGSSMLIAALLEEGLVDEMTLLTIPIVLGQGRRLFPAAGPDLALDLVESRVDSKGLSIHVYRPKGRPQYYQLPTG